MFWQTLGVLFLKSPSTWIEVCMWQTESWYPWTFCIWQWFPLFTRIQSSKIVPGWDNTKGAHGVADPTKTNRSWDSVRTRERWQQGCESDYVLVKPCSTCTSALHWVGGGKDERLKCVQYVTQCCPGQEIWNVNVFSSFPPSITAYSRPFQLS
jgi:hypothetical protein